MAIIGTDLGTRIAVRIPDNPGRKERKLCALKNADNGGRKRPRS